MYITATCSIQTTGIHLTCGSTGNGNCTLISCKCQRQTARVCVTRANLERQHEAWLQACEGNTAAVHACYLYAIYG